jgi:hypothetical protein
MVLAGPALILAWFLIPAPNRAELRWGVGQLWHQGTAALSDQMDRWRGRTPRAPGAEIPVALARPEPLPTKPVSRPPVVPPRAPRATVMLVTIPPGANVIGPRGLVGETPLRYPLRAGRPETVTFTLDGFHPVSRRIKGGRKRPAQIQVTLLPRNAATGSTSSRAP